MPDFPKNKGDALQTRMTPGEKALANSTRPISTKLGSRDPSRRFSAGQVVKFTYRWHTGVQEGEITNDHKEVFVLHPSWQGKMQGIDMKRMTVAERQVLLDVFNSEIQQSVRAGKPHRIPLVTDIIRRMDPSTEIGNPVSFYVKFVKPFIQGKDVYRTYFPRRMWNVTVVHQNDAPVVPVTDPKPMFKKMATKADRDVLKAREKEERQQQNMGAYQRAMKTKGQLGGATKPASKESDRARRLDLIKARQAALKKPR